LTPSANGGLTSSLSDGVKKRFVQIRELNTTQKPFDIRRRNKREVTGFEQKSWPFLALRKNTENEVNFRIFAFDFQFRRHQNSEKSAWEDAAQTFVGNAFEFPADGGKERVDGGAGDVVCDINLGEKV
jgi:hypothetical protein